MKKDKQKYTRDDGKDYYLWNLMVSILRMREARKAKEREEKQKNKGSEKK